MTGERKGIASMVCAKAKESAGEAVRMHCTKHCCKKCPHNSSWRTVPHRFQAFLSDVDAEYWDVLYHSDLHWLSRGSALQQF